ncbi:ras and EF-hand domain-containing protein isoform X2 [Neoarius graeffei]|uniref:ras and EF-hand domain-containing protein isoform X2 n=1 Tax=Neoarius graeffei TaxID=443677 RepID=UPI00298C1BD5|nr:ras and EF-hand domain-containing protein isoform X2 [Neoarius graeffei]
MSSGKPKKSQKFGSSRRHRNHNRNTEEKGNDDGFPDPGNEEHDNEQNQFHTVSENQASNESSLLHSDQPVTACTNPNTSVFEPSPQPQLQDLKDLLTQGEATIKKRKMGSTHKSHRNLKFEGIYEDEPEHRVQLKEGVSAEQGVTVEAAIKKDGDKEDQTNLSDCAPSQSSENENSNQRGKHLALGTIIHNEDNHKNDEREHLEAALQNKPMDISSSEIKQSKEAEFSQDLIQTSLDFNIVTPTECNVPLQELDESLQICHQMDTFSEPVSSLPNSTGQICRIDTISTPLNGNREEGQDVQMSLNNLIHNDKPHMAEHTVLKTVDDQSSLHSIIRDKQEDKHEREDVDTLEGCSAEDIGQDELTGVQAVSLINEHEHVTQDDKVPTVICQNVSTEGSTEDENIIDHCLDHKDDTLKLNKESICKSKSTEFREDIDEYEEVSDAYLTSESESTPISHPVSEPRPGIEEVRTTVVKDTNAPCVVSTRGRPKIDSEQWNEQLPDFGQAVYNVVMVGNSNVGKTSFIKRLQSGHFITDYNATIGVDTFVQTVTFGSRTVKLYVWDTAGQERYHSITRQVFHKAQGLLLMYDITSSQSFHAVRAWISQVQEKASPDVILMLLGNKNDCVNREVQLQEGEDLSKEYNIHFMECSAATGENVSESLKTLAWLLVKQKVRKEEEHTTLQPKPQNKKSGCC